MDKMKSEDKLDYVMIKFIFLSLNYIGNGTRHTFCIFCSVQHIVVLFFLYSLMSPRRTVREQCVTESLCFLRTEELKCRKRFSRNTTGLTNLYVLNHLRTAVTLLVKESRETFEACVILS